MVFKKGRATSCILRPRTTYIKSRWGSKGIICPRQDNRQGAQRHGVACLLFIPLPGYYANVILVLPLEESVKTISLKLPEPLDARLTTLIQKRGMSKSAIIREALEEYLSREGEPNPGSFLELAQDLCGCVEGAVDLSTNQGHLDGYGQ